MKIAITAKGNNLESEVDPRFGRCSFFIVYNTETKKFDAIENPSSQLGGGAGTQTAMMVVDQGVRVVLTGNVGPNAFMTLQAAEIEVFTGVTGKVSQAIDGYKGGKLSSSSLPTVEFHHGMNVEPKESEQDSKTMIAVASDNDQGMETSVSAHFGRCPFYILVGVSDGKVETHSCVSNPFYGDHGQTGQVPGFIRDQGAHVIIAGGMGQRAVGFFSEFNIEVVTGAQGSVKEAVEAYLQGSLKGATGCNHKSC